MPIQSIGWAICVEIAVLDGVGERAEGVEDVVGVGAAQQGVEPPPVVDRVDAAHLVVRRRRACPRVRTFDGLITMPSSRSVALGAHRLQGEAVGEQLVMGDGDGGLRVGETGRVVAGRHGRGRRSTTAR